MQTGLHNAYTLEPLKLLELFPLLEGFDKLPLSRDELLS